MYPAERSSYVTLPARLSQWDFNYGPAIDGSSQMSDFQKNDRRQMNKRGIARTNIHYDGKKQKSRRRIKTTPLQILDHALSYLLLWQSPMHCAVRCIFTYALGTGVAHIFAKFSAVEQCVRHSKELHRLYDRGT